MMDTPEENVAGVAAEVPANVDAVPHLSVGVILREARISHGLDVAEVAHRTKFAPRQIEALEADDFAHLPEMAFVRGFVRSYARVLQMDPAPLLVMLPQPVVQSVPLEAKVLTEVPFSAEQATRKLNLVWLAAALAVAVVLALLVWMMGQAPSVQQAKVETLELPAPEPALALAPTLELAPAPAPAPVPVPVPVPAPAPAPAPAIVAAPQTVSIADQSPKRSVAEAKPVVAVSGHAIRLVFDKQAWVEIKDKDGKVMLSLVGTPGSEQGVDGSPPFSVTIGYASGVRLYYKDKLLDLAPYVRSEVAHLTLE
ncbi:MAG: helix-turn-helix domain-containing protein [Nitrosomonadales bacterium]|nr:helix-turn-helix domain-containing protein [Nitrosomonadales bacterium]